MLFVIFLSKDNLPCIIFNSAKIIIIIMCIKTQKLVFWIQFLFWISIYLQFLLIPLFFFFFQPVGPYILLLSFWAFPLQTIFFKIIFTFNKKKKHKKLYFDQWNNFLGVSFFSDSWILDILNVDIFFKIMYLLLCFLYAIDLFSSPAQNFWHPKMSPLIFLYLVCKLYFVFSNTSFCYDFENQKLH